MSKGQDKYQTDNGQKFVSLHHLTHFKNSKVFVSETSLTEDALAVCKYLYIDPECLFASKDGASAKICNIRMQHYDDKRKAKIRLISDMIKNGMLDQLKERYNLEQLEKNRALKASQSSNATIPLRVPYGTDLTLRKQASQVIDTEIAQKVAQNLEKIKMKKELEIESTERQITEKQMKVEKNRKDLLKAQQKQVKQYLEKVEQQIAKKKLNDKRYERDQREAYKTMEQEDQEFRQQRQELEEKRLQEQHKADLETFHKIYQKRQYKNQTEDNFFKAIEESFQELTENMRTHDRNREQQIRERVERVKKHMGFVEAKIKHVQEHRISGQHLSEQAELIEKLAISQKKVEDNRKKLEKQKRNELHEKLELEAQTIQANKKNLKRAEKEKYAYLMDKQNTRDTSVQDTKQALMEDIFQRKEIALLRKKDQEENRKRGQHFNNLEKQLLWSKLQEKKARAELIKKEQERIAQACASQKIASKVFPSLITSPRAATQNE